MSWFKFIFPSEPKLGLKVPVVSLSRRADEKVANAIKALTEALEQKGKKK